VDKECDGLRVFVYGTLKPGEPNYQRFCSGKVVEVRTAIAQGQLFKLPAGYPAMTSGLGWVHGFVLTFADSKVLSELDDYEDYQVGQPPHFNLYQRQPIQTFGLNGQQLRPAWVYLMALERVHDLRGILLPDGYWC